MPIILEVKKPCLCKNKPNPDNYGTGTIWECDDCGKQYILEWYSDYRESFYSWKFYANPKKL